MDKNTGFHQHRFAASQRAGIEARAGRRDRYRFILAPDGRPSYIVSLNGGRSWGYNGGPADEPGPDKPEWRQVVGEYTVKVAGKPIASSKITVENGYLYATVMGTALRLEEHQPGLFFTSTGQALDLRDKMMFAGVFELELDFPHAQGGNL